MPINISFFTNKYFHGIVFHGTMTGVLGTVGSTISLNLKNMNDSNSSNDIQDFSWNSATNQYDDNGANGYIIKEGVNQYAALRESWMPALPPSIRNTAFDVTIPGNNGGTLSMLYEIHVHLNSGTIMLSGVSNGEIKTIASKFELDLHVG